MVSVTDIARRVGVSPSTVSRALSGRPGASEEIRRIVLEAAREMGYVPNRAATSLRSGVTHVIGYVARTARPTESDNFSLRLYEGLQPTLLKSGLELFVIPTSYSDDQIPRLERIIAMGVFDALVIASIVASDPRIRLLQERRFPFVTLGRDTSQVGYDWVEVDQADFARKAVQRLLSRGRTRIAVTAPSDSLTFGDGIVGDVGRALAAGGSSLEDQFVIPCEATESAGYHAARRLADLPGRPDAVILTNTSHTIGFYGGLAASGLVPGLDIDVIGFRTPYAEHLRPSFTCYEHPPESVGQHLAHALLQRLRRISEPDAPLVTTLLPLTLVEGESA